MIIHQCISGFTQNVNTLHGILKLSERLRQFTAPDCLTNRIMLDLWNTDWAKIAEFYWILSEYYLENPIICVYAYSWGAGWGAMQFARHLEKIGLNIRVMVLSDPVYRHPHWYLKWTSLLHRDSKLVPTIRVPGNVQEVFSFHQRINRPMGHRLLPTNGTIIHPSYEIHTTHQKMDDAWKFHALSLEVARRVINRESLNDIDLDHIDLTNYLDFH